MEQENSSRNRRKVHRFVLLEGYDRSGKSTIEYTVDSPRNKRSAAFLNRIDEEVGNDTSEHFFSVKSHPDQGPKYELTRAMFRRADGYTNSVSKALALNEALDMASLINTKTILGGEMIFVRARSILSTLAYDYVRNDEIDETMIYDFDCIFEEALNMTADLKELDITAFVFRVSKETMIDRGCSISSFEIFNYDKISDGFNVAIDAVNKHSNYIRASNFFTDGLNEEQVQDKFYKELYDSSFKDRMFW